jgi:hypothetical protein
VGKGSHGALSAPGRLTPQTLMKAGAMPLRPASTVGGLMYVDSTSHVTTANLETLMAVSSASTPASIWINQWLSGVSQSEEGVCNAPSGARQFDVDIWVLPRQQREL